MSDEDDLTEPEYAEIDRRIGQYFRHRSDDGWLRLRIVERPGNPDSYALVMEFDEGYMGEDVARDQMEWNRARFARLGLDFMGSQGTHWTVARWSKDDA